MINPEDAASVANETAALYQQAELLLIAAMTARIEALGDAPNWLLAQQLEEHRLRAHVAGIASVVSEKSSPLVAAALVDAYEIGRKAAEKELAAHGVDAVRVGLTGSVEEAARSRVVIERAGIELMSNLNTQLSHVPHTVMDGWRRIVAEVSTDLLRGDVSPMDAARKAHTRFAREGYGFFVDKAGRRWGLDTYAEMAVRSAANDLMIDAHSAALVAAGEDLVIVSSHRNPAPQCAPFERRVLSLTGQHANRSQRIGDTIVSVKASLDEARARGFQHPNCRHTISLYQPGVTPPEVPEPDPDHAGYKATQHQRYLERQIRASKQMEAAAVTQEDKRLAQARARNYQARLREHVREWDLPRRRHREQVRVPDWTE